ncbi:glycosyltransferase family protein [Polluticaenibacter yanchengensis]|uniref:Glycosyltransferase n=1 Tax=Polluticaenibacter yanchengensis TaxID=3014562 RepID=A0ABT4UNK3_9BACT|nr:hypothetical protein [Chitinophagaceae bacterium LY-5]
MKQSSNYYITYSASQITEGGQSRTAAFFRYFEKKDWNIINVYAAGSKGRILKMIKYIWFLYFVKNKTLFIHFGALVFLFSASLINKPKVLRFFLTLLQRLAGNNKVIIEVNDLPFEQSIDLGLPVEELYKKFQDGLFSIKNIHFIFASNTMEQYVSQNFHLKNTGSIINGSNALEDSVMAPDYDWILSNTIKCIYAGTLNEGREIHSLIRLFKELKHITLVLMGGDGEWLKDESLPGNIKYIGSYPENIAQKIVSQCDLGIIHYDAGKFYYNLCYPTKASFYIAAKIPFLSTPLTELKNHFSNFEGAYFVEFDKWILFLDNITREILIKDKMSISRNYKRFTWPYLLSPLDNILKNPS